MVTKEGELCDAWHARQNDNSSYRPRQFGPQRAVMWLVLGDMAHGELHAAHDTGIVKVVDVPGVKALEHHYKVDLKLRQMRRHIGVGHCCLSV